METAVDTMRSVGFYDDDRSLSNAMRGMVLVLRSLGLETRRYPELSESVEVGENIFIINPHPGSDFAEMRMFMEDRSETGFYMVVPAREMERQLREEFGEKDISNLNYIYPDSFRSFIRAVEEGKI